MEQVPKPRDSHFFQIPSWLNLKHGQSNSKDSKFDQNEDSSFQKKLSEEVKKIKAKKERLSFIGPYQCELAPNVSHQASFIQSNRYLDILLF